MQQISAHICDRGGGSVAAISFPVKKTTALSFHSSALHVFVFVGRQGLRFLVETINTSSPFCARDDG